MGEAEIIPRPHAAFRRWQRWQSNVLSSYWRSRIDEDPQFSRVVMTAEIIFGGDKVVRVCVNDKPITTTSTKDGNSFTYQPVGLKEPAVGHAYVLGTGTSSARSFSFALPNDVVKAQNIVSNGRMMAGFGEISLQVDGGDWDSRLVIIRGEMDDGVAFGTNAGSIVEFSLADPKIHGNLNLSPWVVGEERNASYAGLLGDNAVGQRYPVIYGTYDIPTLELQVLSTAPLLLVAFGHGHTINSANVNGEIASQINFEFGWTVLEEFDSFGIPYTALRITGNRQWDQSETIHVNVTSASAYTDVLGIIKAIIKAYTTLGSGGIDEEAFGLAQAKLGAKSVNILINGSGDGTAAKAIDFIEGGILPSFPMISMAWGNGGYGPIVTDRRSSLIRANLTVGTYPIIDRSSDLIETAKNELYNNFTLRYDWSPIQQNYVKVVTRHPSNSDLCSISRENIGERHMEPVESVYISEDGVAEYVADWMVDHFSLPSYYVEYTCYPWVFLFLRRGDNIKLTDSEFGWTNEIATVESIEYNQGLVTIGLRVWWMYYELGGGSRNLG